MSPWLLQRAPPLASGQKELGDPPVLSNFASLAQTLVGVSPGISGLPAAPDTAQPQGTQASSSKPLVCQFCNASFASNNGLRGHINKMHFHYTPFKCELCGKGFNFKRHFEGHMNTHNNLKVFKCGECSCKFTYKASLWRHIRSKHDREPS
jgi:uncharacterized Zn-finger protein